MVVEADLAEGDALGMGGERREFNPRIEGSFGCLVGVDADGGVDEGVGIGEADGGFEVRGAVAGADGEHGVDAGRAGAVDHGLAVGVKGFRIEMAMGIDERHYSASVIC